MSAIDTYLDRNAEHAASFTGGELPAAPARAIAVVTCMDARLDPTALLGLETGDAHVIRNAGGIITDDVIRSLAISQAVLGTREIMLIHHTRCGMMLKEVEIQRAIEAATGTRPDFSIGSFADLEGNVRESIARIQACPQLAHRDAVRGFVYEIETGRLREVE